MHIKIEISSESKIRYSINFEKAIKRLLNVIPKDHLNKLNKVIVMNTSPEKKFSNAEGLYYSSNNGKPAHIILIANNMFKGFPNWFLRTFPYFTNYFIADVLFHEVGHHYQQLTHGIKRRIKENHAEVYSKEMKRVYFDTLWICKILRIILLIFRKEKN